jgi:hypothetical protein
LFELFVGEFGIVNPFEFWELTIRQCNLIASGVKKRQEMQDVRMRRGWKLVMSSMGSKIRDEKILWPLEIDIIHAEMKKNESITAVPELMEFANKTLNGKTTNETWQ